MRVRLSASRQRLTREEVWLKFTIATVGNSSAWGIGETVTRAALIADQMTELWANRFEHQGQTKETIVMEDDQPAPVFMYPSPAHAPNPCPFDGPVGDPGGPESGGAA